MFATPSFNQFFLACYQVLVCSKKCNIRFFWINLKIELNHQVHKPHQPLIIYMDSLIKSGRLIDYNLTQTEKLGSSDVKLQSKKHRK